MRSFSDLLNGWCVCACKCVRVCVGRCTLFTFNSQDRAKLRATYFQWSLWSRDIYFYDLYRDLRVRAARMHSSLSCPLGGFESKLGYKLQPWCFTDRVIHQCVGPVSRMDVKLDVPSAGISWWSLKIPRCPSRRVGELSPTP